MNVRFHLINPYQEVLWYSTLCVHPDPIQYDEEWMMKRKLRGTIANPSDGHRNLTICPEAGAAGADFMSLTI